MVDLNKPAIGTTGWGTALNANFDSLEGELNGRLSDAEISATIGAVSAEQIANPETPANSAVVEIVNDVLGGGVSGLVIVVDARGIPSTPRPAWAGIVDWMIDEGQGDPIYYSSGDRISEVSTEPIPFSPLDLNPAMWFDAASISGVANNDNVSAWENLAPSGPDAALTLGTIQYQAEGINGHPALFSAGAARMMAGDYAPHTSPLTVFLVAQCTQLPSTTPRFAIDEEHATAGGDRLGIQFGATQYGIVRSTTITGAGPTDTNPHLIEAVFNGASSSFSVDDGAPVTGTTSTSTATVRLSLFNRGGAGSGSFVGKIASVLVVPGVLTADQRAATRQYLSDRYSLGLA